MSGTVHVMRPTISFSRHHIFIKFVHFKFRNRLVQSCFSNNIQNLQSCKHNLAIYTAQKMKFSVKDFFIFCALLISLKQIAY